MARFLPILVALAVLPIPGEKAAAQDPGCVTTLSRDKLLEVTASGDLSLQENGAAHLAGIRLPEEGRWRSDALKFLQNYQDLPIVVEVKPQRDRWNRTSVILKSEGDERDAAAALVGQGLGLVDKAPGEAFCETRLFAIEALARRSGLGLWAEDRYKPVPVEDLDRLRQRIGQFALVEGVVKSVGERKDRTYLNFAARWNEDFTLIIPKRTWSALVQKGHTSRTLRGALVRARGILETWQGVSMTVDEEDMLEVENATRKL